MKLTSADLRRIKESQERNFRERLDFIGRWVKWMQEHPDTWSREQKRLIDSLIPA